MTFGTTENKPWVEALPTEHGEFTGRTFSRFHVVGGSDSIPTVCEIWATSDHAVEAHAHNADELLYVVTGVISLNNQVLKSNGVVFIPRGASYRARVLSDGGAHVLRIELPNAGNATGDAEYEVRVWTGPLTESGMPDLSSNPHDGVN